MNFINKFSKFIFKNNVIKYNQSLNMLKSNSYCTKTISMSYNLYKNDSKQEAGLITQDQPLIIMHGLLGSKANWRGMSKALQKKFNPYRKIYAVDARNHGETPHTSEHNYEYLADDIATFLYKHKIDKCCAMGHSMGGRAVMYFALKYPHLVDRIIIVDVSPTNMPRDFIEMKNIFKLMKETNVTQNLSLAEGRKLVGKEMKIIVKNDATANFLLQNLTKTEKGFEWLCNVDALSENLESITNFPQDIVEESQYTGPALFIGGSKANFLSPKEWPDIQKTFPNSTLSMLDCGHLIHFEKPAEFTSLVVNFLNKRLVS